MMTDREGAIAMIIRTLAVAPVAASAGGKVAVALVAANTRHGAGRSLVAAWTRPNLAGHRFGQQP